MANLITACEQLEAEGFPVPIIHCGVCDGRNWRKGKLVKCPDCGAEGAGFHTLALVGEKSAEWKAETVAAQLRLDELLAEQYSRPKSATL